MSNARGRKGGRGGTPKPGRRSQGRNNPSAARGRPGAAAGGRSTAPRGGDDRQRGRQRDPDDLGGDRVEGRQAVVELLRVGKRKVREIVVAEDIDDSVIVAEILDLAAEDRVPVTRVARRKLDELARTDAPQGVIATAKSVRATDFDDLTQPFEGRQPFLLMLDGITDPGNLGAILRTAEVAGVTGVVIPRHRAARLTPAAVKSAAGAVEYLRISLVGGLPAAMGQLADKGIWTIGLAARAPQSIWESTAAFDGPVAMVLGAEGAGLGRLVSERCDELVSIPQFGKLDSLNVANAAAVACYEVVRRRS
ncbi:MAG: 23S rRNA (guanosine(2251)-2'-O)-methyltransferase RlmB [Acidimicrobiales bacterium]|nr:23S rRNA (guanosine(2251)-2'-O)-methyltransferase RlmB [Acidimicrobiales bacterium]